jgi:hypothetical protein
MSNTINYIVSYDSDYLMPDGSVNPSAIVLANVTNLVFQRNIAPSEDNVTITLAGIQKIVSAREIYIYRVNSDGTYTLKFRGMTTNPEYDVSDAELVTTFQVNSLWYMLATRLFQIAGKSPPPLQPNTNPYLVYLNPTLGLRFGQLWADILVTAFQTSYSTGHLPAFQLANFADNGYVNPTTHQTTFLNPDIMYFTDFDNIVVNDNLNVQYQNISATIDRLVTSALFNPSQNQPFLAEYRLDIGDFPYTIPPRPSGSLTDTFAPKLPTATVMLFDPVHSALGNGNNRTGIHLGDNSCNISAKLANDPTLLGSDPIYSPMAYVEFGVYNGYDPIDTIVFSEGDNIVSIKFTSDYISMNNSFVLTGGSFQGSDVVAIPIDNQRSIAEYGLKQTNQTLNNVVDQGEIQRYVGTSINFFQHPIPNIILKPDYVYASTHTMYPGDYILVNAPSLSGVIEDSNGNPLIGSYNPTGGLITAAFTARIKTIDITWSPDQGEDITLTLTFPVQNVPIEQWNAVHSFQEQGSYGGAMQFMYTTVNPASKTLLGRGRQAEGGAIHQGGGDFITNRATPFQLRCEDYEDSGTVYPDAEAQAIPVYAQSIPNTMNAIDTAGNPVKADDILLYQFGVEVDASNSSSANQITTLGVTASSAPNSVYLTVIQPDGMAIYDKVINLNQLADILSLISKSHASPPTLTSSAPFLTDDGGNANVSGKYMVVIRNTGAISWCPDPLFSTLPAASITGGTAPFPPEGSQYLYCPVDSYGNEFALSNYSISGYVATPGSHIFLSWPAVIDPTTGSAVTRYNVYRAVLGIADILTLNILQLIYLDFTATNSYEDNGTLGGDANTQPFVQSLDTSAPETPPGLNVVYDGTPVGAGSQLALGHQYWYLITAIDPDNNETALSQVCTPFNLPLSNTNTNTQPEPYNNSVPEGGTYTVAQTTGTTTAGTTATVLQDSGKAWTVNALVGFTLEYTSGPAIGEERTILSNTATSITTAAFSPAPNGSGDTYTLVSSEIVITWPSVPYAQSYNVYRADGGTSNTMPTSTSGTPLKATNYDLLVQGVMAPLQIVDDGLTYTLDTSTHPPVSYTISPANNAYTVYVNYSYQANPKFTKAIVNAQTANPNNAVVFDPTQQWVYQPHPYVSP